MEKARVSDTAFAGRRRAYGALQANRLDIETSGTYSVLIGEVERAWTGTVQVIANLAIRRLALRWQAYHNAYLR
jgi:hypothetical protein